jgi:membrane fusion protein (multidrug efflux system)
MENHSSSLKPGMFVNVEVLLDRSETKLFIPASSVQYSAAGSFVYVIDESSGGSGDGQQFGVQRKPVQLGITKGDFVEVVDGLMEGERVISTGVFKIRPETMVVIDTSLAPEFSFSPTPDNT